MEYLEHNGVILPLIGFGTWTLGDDVSKRNSEVATILYGIENFSMTLIDTAEMYGLGKSESVVKAVLSKVKRESVFVVDKILPENARKGKYIECCKRSLEKLGIDYIDLYLLHWREKVNLQEMVNSMEKLVSMGLIKRWGVSNFDVSDMEELFKCENGSNCFCNQVLYNIGARGPEFDLIPWCKSHNVLFMAYSPLYNNSFDRENITKLKKIIDLASHEHMTPESLMLNFVTRNKDIVTIFKTSNIEHLKNNMENVFNELSKEAENEINVLFPSPVKKVELLKI